MLRTSILWIALATATGCGTTGTFSLVPPGEPLTRQAEAVLEQAPAISEQPRELAKTVLPAMYLQPGEALLIEPTRFDSELRLPPDQTILPDGSIDLGEYGRIVVAGLTPEQAEQLVQERITDVDGETTDVNIQVIDSVLGFYVLGEVNAPGFYALNGNETVLDAIMAAGGITDRSATCDILLARPTAPRSCRVVLPICYRQITQLGDTSTNYQVQPGDRIFVPTRSFWDDLAFWRASATCSRCKCSPQSSCGTAFQTYTNPIAFLPSEITEPAASIEAEELPPL